MNDVRVSQSVISKTLSVSPARKLRSVPGFPHISLREMYHARPALHTVFSTTQLGHSITRISTQAITDLRMLPVIIPVPGEISLIFIHLRHHSPYGNGDVNGGRLCLFFSGGSVFGLLLFFPLLKLYGDMEVRDGCWSKTGDFFCFSDCPRAVLVEFLPDFP